MGYIGKLPETDRKKLITLENLETFLSHLQSSVDTQLNINSNNPIANSTVTDRFEKSFWKGSMAQFNAAVAAGKITKDTVVEIDDDYEEVIYEFSTKGEIEYIFNK